jgi:hypothetical protein
MQDPFENTCKIIFNNLMLKKSVNEKSSDEIISRPSSS